MVLPTITVIGIGWVNSGGAHDPSGTNAGPCIPSRSAQGQYLLNIPAGVVPASAKIVVRAWCRTPANRTIEVNPTTQLTQWSINTQDGATAAAQDTDWFYDVMMVQ